MGALAVPLMVGGTVLQAGSQLEQGALQKSIGQYEAAGLKQAATQQLASGQRSAEEIDRQTQYIASKALATAAASGGGASDPTVMNIISQIHGEGAYKKSVAIYQGQARAQELEVQAGASEFGGEAAQKMSYLGAASTIASGGASLYGKYGGGGPKTGWNA